MIRLFSLKIFFCCFSLVVLLKPGNLCCYFPPCLWHKRQLCFARWPPLIPEAAGALSEHDLPLPWLPGGRQKLGHNVWDTEKLQDKYFPSEWYFWLSPNLPIHYSSNHHKRPQNHLFILDLLRQPLSTAALMLSQDSQDPWPMNLLKKMALVLGSLHCPWIKKPSKPPPPPQFSETDPLLIVNRFPLGVNLTDW